MFRRERTDRDPESPSASQAAGKSRRDFLRSAAAGLSAAAVTGAGQVAGGQQATDASEPETFTEPARKIPVIAEVDVVVVGGGPGGGPAALAAARAGAKAMLVERYAFLGGNATAGLMTCYNGFRNQRSPNDTQTVKGIPAEIVAEIHKAGGTSPDVAYPQEAGDLDSGELTYCVGLDPEVVKHVQLRMLVDAGVELLLHSWGAAAIRDGNRVAGVIVQNKSGRQAIRAKVTVDASGDGDIAADAGAECFMAQKSKRLSWSLMLRMANVDKEKLRGMPGILVGDSMIVWGPGIGSVDGTDVRDLTRAEIETRLKIPQYVANRRSQPGFEDAYLVESATNIGVRETRHILGGYFLTATDVIQGKRFKDVVAIGSNPIPGYPEPDGRRRRYFLEHEGYDIPYRCLVPKRIDGLLTSGRCISHEPLAAQSARAMATCMAIGQAAGSAAALAAKANQPPRQVAVKSLQRLLLEQNAELRL